MKPDSNTVAPGATSKGRDAKGTFDEASRRRMEVGPLKEHRIAIADEVLEDLKTVRDAVDYVSSRLG